LLRCDEEEFAPAIALYAEGKPVRMCPRFVERQASELTQAILSSAGVFVVGVRVWPADEHLWGPLARTPASIHYFGLNGDRDDFARWTTSVGRTTDSFIEARFPDALRQMAELHEQMSAS
jgi:hypothetical protein